MIAPVAEVRPTSGARPDPLHLTSAPDLASAGGATTTPARVVRMTLEAADVVSFELRTADGSPWPAWEPGAHVDLHLPSGTIRQYSLCGDPRDRRVLRVAVLRQEAGRGGSREVHDVLRLGQVLPVGAPRNAFRWEPSASCTFVAGGIGITPILPMLRAAHEHGCDWRLLYGGRSREAMAFLGELGDLPAERVEIVPADEAGFLPIERIAAAAANAPVYCCGPAGLLEALEALVEPGDGTAGLRVERFAAAAVAPSAGAAEGVVSVILARAGLTLDVPPEQTLLEAIRAAGVDVPSSCEQGICGTCECRVIDGTPDHRDALLTPDERAAGRVILPCVSRAVGGPITLDL